MGKNRTDQTSLVLVREQKGSDGFGVMQQFRRKGSLLRSRLRQIWGFIFYDRIAGGTLRAGVVGGLEWHIYECEVMG